MRTASSTAEALVNQWRTSGDNNPAGPLFTTPYAEADLAQIGWEDTRQTCSSCTASRTAQCC